MNSQSSLIKETLGFILRGMIASVLSVVAVYVWMFPASLIGLAIVTIAGTYAPGEWFITITSSVVAFFVSFRSFYLFPDAVGNWKLDEPKRTWVAAAGALIVVVVLSSTLGKFLF